MKYTALIRIASFLARRPLLLLVLAAARLQAQTPEWIWHDNKGEAPRENEVRFFRKAFEVEGPISRARLMVAGDDQAIVFLNGRQVGVSRSWNRALMVNAVKEIKAGANLIAVRGQNTSGDAAVIARLEITLANDQTQVIVTDPSWVSSAASLNHWYAPGFDAGAWTKVVSRGKLGVQPWGDVLAPPMATPADKITLRPGFKVELVRSAEPGEGSWVSLTIDAKGRLIFSPQEGLGNMLRATLSPSGQIEKIERIDTPVGAAMGLLYAFDSLYVSGNGPKGLGLYRLRDTKGADRFDEVRLLKKIEGAAGEHGSHGLVAGPDGKLYSIHGNFVKVPADISPNSPHKNYAEDQLLPRGEDGNGFGVGIKPPGGFLLRTDPDGTNWQLVAAGLRNAYDFDINPEGEIFTYDSDMEWDWGMPWYRPTRIYHLVSGGDYGFREGTGKYPAHYPDSLPPTLDLGIGSPTGMKFGAKSQFPPKYQKALFAMDWSYGRIFAVHLSPRGATYTATSEVFLQGKPLNVTDLEFGRDGAMYFLTGGRGTQSGLYRVSSVGGEDKSILPDGPHLQEAAAARDVRHKLEAFHGRKDPAAVDFVWPHLESPDRWIRYAARIALESQDLALWKERALQEERINASLTALLALARRVGAGSPVELLESLGRLPADQFTESQFLEALRVLSLAFIRMGKPDSETAVVVIDKLNPLYPAKSWPVNRDLAQVLIYLNAPGVVPKTLTLLEAAPTQEEQIHYVFHLRKLKAGWTLDQRRQYFAWFNKNRAVLQHPPEMARWFEEAGRAYSDGASFPKFIANIRKDAMAGLTESERNDLWSTFAGEVVTPKPPALPRNFVKDWRVEDLLPWLEQASPARSFARGERAFNDAQCIACHRFGNEGGSVGPELTAISSRFTRRDILDSILEPSKVVSEQFQNTTIVRRNGEDASGRLVEEDDQKLVLVTDPLKQTRVEIAKSEIQKRIPSKISAMPEGLVNLLTQEEILDLLAYLEAGGRKEAFKGGK